MDEKRRNEKQKKQEKEEALQNICKQSLDEDRKKAAEQRSLKLAKKPALPPTPTTPASTSSSSGGSDTNVRSASNTSGAAPFQSHPVRHRGYRPSMGLPQHQLSPSPMRELENEDEADSEADSRSRSGKSGRQSGERGGRGVESTKAVPKHHAQLYELYGKQADYFLHPKPAQIPVQRRPTHPKLKNQKTHIGAGQLWDTLRTDSMGKLIRTDMRFPSELKSAFSAFVRERLTKHSKPVARSFCATEDVPDIKRLMDQSKLRKTRMDRHKTELMYRSSVTNMDRTSILLHSNPLSDITETGGVESISRYLPSWLDDQSEVSEEDYMKWIRERPALQGAPQDEDGEDDKENEPGRQSSGELQGILASLAKPRKQKTNTPRIHFLTEKASECEGGFSQKFQDEKDLKEKPPPYHVTKSYSVMELSHPTSAFSVSSSQERGRAVQSAMQLKRYRSDWQPLSMSALIEYKAQKEVEGQGEFEHGRMKMWPVAAASTSS